MAPFVEREWGAKATEMMWRIKQLADPAGVLGPGVVLNRDPQIHLKHLKTTPEIEESVTKCIECGFCEPVCPSQNLTTTPRQRIVLRREMARQPAGSPVLDALLEQYEYDGIETCAADGSCQRACPVAIDTGELVKDLRRRQHSARQRAGRARGRQPLRAGSSARPRRTARRRPWFRATLGRPGRGRHPGAAAPAGGRRAGPDVERQPAQRRPGAGFRSTSARWRRRRLPAGLHQPDLRPAARGRPGVRRVPEALVAVSARAGLPLWIPSDVAGRCCATPWSSKGYRAGSDFMAAETSAALRRWTEDGRLPVVIDASSCTHGAIENLDLDGIEVIDSVAWVHDRLLDRLSVSRRLGSMVVHPTCAAGHLGVAGKLTAIADRHGRRAWWCRPAPGAAARPVTGAGCTPNCPARRLATWPRSSTAPTSTAACRATAPASWPCKRSPAGRINRSC